MKKLYNDLVLKLERISTMSRDDAKKVLFESLENDVKLEKQQWLAKVDEETKVIAKERSIDI